MKRKPSGIRATCFHAGAHLDSTELEPPVSSCPLCLAEGPRMAVFPLQRDPDVDLLSCPSCGGRSASRMPSPAALRSYYADYYGGSEEEEKVTFDAPARLAGRIVHGSFSTVPRRPVDVLDFGGGDATISREIARFLLDAGVPAVRILLVDLVEEVRPSDSDRVEIRRAASVRDTQAKAFDIVLASAILEHVPDARADLVALLSALRPGGTFYARTPSVAPMLKAAQMVGIDLDFTFPAHVHDLGQNFWETILDRLPLDASFEIVESRPSIVETTLSRHPLRTIAAHALKAPWRVFGRAWAFVGGWEVFVRRAGAPESDRQRIG